MALVQRILPRAVQHPRPIFLLGHPKSGTTVIAKLLAEATGESLTIDLFRSAGIRREETERLFGGELPLADLVRHHPRAFSSRLNKCPKLTYFYPQLRDLFPEARFAYIVRDPRAALRSFLGWRSIPGNVETLTDPDQRAHVDVLPRQPAGHYIARMAQRWNQAAQVYLHNPADFALIRYEDFHREPREAIRRLALDVGLEPRHDVSGRVHVSHKASGVRHVSYQSFFGETNLTRIESTCAPSMAAFGYA